MRTLKNLLTLAIVAIATVALASCGKETKTLRVGMECTYAPFNWTETKATTSNAAIKNIPGSYAEGYDVQIARKVASDLNLELEVHAIEWDGLIQALNAGIIDMVIAGMSPTDKRKETIDFSDSYYTSQHVMLVNASSDLKNATKLADFAGKKVVGQLGTSYADLAAQTVEKWGAIAGVNKSTVPSILLDMKAGLTDGQVLELPVAKGIVSRDSSFAYVTFADGQGFEVTDEDTVVAVGVKKSSALRTSINATLAKISEEQRVKIMQNAVDNAPQDAE